MPSGWIDPEQFLRHHGIAVYHVYRHDDYDEGPREYWYTTDLYGGDCDDPCSFDVRELSSYTGEKTHEQIIREAIDAGELPLEECKCLDDDRCESVSSIYKSTVLEFCFDLIDADYVGTSILVYIHTTLDSDAIIAIEDAIISYVETMSAWSFEQLITDVLNSFDYTFIFLMPKHTYHI